MKCSHPTCGADGTLLWQRLATPAEADGRVQQTAEAILLGDELRRHQQRLGIRSLEAAAADPEFDPRSLPALERQIAAEKAVLDVMVDAELRVDDRPTLIAVAGCDDHKIGLDPATGIHEPTCMADGTCGCAVDYPVPTPL